jgi:hypothetical protein
VNPLIRFALAHAKQASLHHLEGIGFQVDQNEEQPIFGCRQTASYSCLEGWNWPPVCREATPQRKSAL